MGVTFVRPHGYVGHPNEHDPVILNQGHFYEGVVQGSRTGGHNICTGQADRLRVDQ